MSEAQRENGHRLALTHAASFFADFPEVTPQSGTVLVRTRAISARVNKNYDGFPSEQLKAAHQTFVGRPVFVNHNNLNHRETRGIIKGSVYKDEGRDKHVDLLIEIDARAFPRLAAEIEAGRLDGVSMGTDVKHTICSFCDNVARDPYEFCSHILYHKGSILDRVTSSFERESVLVYEVCEGLNFFEISFVFDPADETALVQEVYVPGGYNSSVQKKDSAYEFLVIPKLSYDDTVAPSDVDTLREQHECPQCSDESFDGEHCLWCDYIAPPQELADPDLEQAKQTDLRQEIDDALMNRQQQGAPTMAARRTMSSNPFVRRS